MRLLLIALLLHLLPATAKAENFLPYYDLINKAERSFVLDQNPIACFAQYDAAFKAVSKPFVKDYFIAAEIAFYTGDTSRFQKYMQCCFQRGMALNTLHAAPLFEAVFRNDVLLAKLQSLANAQRVLPVDSAVRDSTYRRYYGEQVRKRDADPKQFYAQEKENTDWFNRLLAKGLFPSEQLIGLFTEAGGVAYVQSHNVAVTPDMTATLADLERKLLQGNIPEDYDLWSGAAYYSYLHYPCAFSRNKKAFWNAVERGYVHPKDYCMLEEWAARAEGNPNYVHDCKVDVKPVYYNIVASNAVNTPEALVLVSQNRAERHLQSYEVDLRKKAMKKETGIVFFFGFFHRR